MASVFKLPDVNVCVCVCGGGGGGGETKYLINLIKMPSVFKLPDVNVCVCVCVGGGGGGRNIWFILLKLPTLGLSFFFFLFAFFVCTIPVILFYRLLALLWVWVYMSSPVIAIDIDVYSAFAVIFNILCLEVAYDSMRLFYWHLHYIYDLILYLWKFLMRYIKIFIHSFMFMYYTICYFTGIFYAVVRQISMLFIDNKISVLRILCSWLKRKKKKGGCLDASLFVTHADSSSGEWPQIASSGRKGPQTLAFNADGASTEIWGRLSLRAVRAAAGMWEQWGMSVDRLFHPTGSTCVRVTTHNHQGGVWVHLGTDMVQLHSLSTDVLYLLS